MERRASLSLAAIFALRMLGLFLVLPVFALEAARYPGGDDPALVGLAMGIYGLTQGFLQIPFGMASDRLGRKRVIVAGLLVFALGSLVAALADSLTWLIIGRSLQGAGAVSAAVTALLADQTRDEVRTKAMALVGASIGLMFALSLVLAPAAGEPHRPDRPVCPDRRAGAGRRGGGDLVGAARAAAAQGHAARQAVRGADPRRRLLRLDFGVFMLHAVQLAMWVAIPALLVQAGLAKAQHWWVYLPAVLASFVVMGATLFPLEKRGYLRAVFLAAIGLIGLVQLGLLWVASAPQHRLAGASAVRVFLRLQRAGSQPAQPGLARGAGPCARRGAGGLQHAAVAGFFCRRRGRRLAGQDRRACTACSWPAAVGMVLWLLVAWPMKAPSGRRRRRHNRC